MPPWCSRLRRANRCATAKPWPRATYDGALAAGEGGNWLARRLIERRAEAVAREIARARNERLARRGVLDDLGVPAAVLDEPVGWTMVEPELREEYDQRAPKAVARARRAPTELDRAVARAEVVAEDSGDAEAMRQVAALREALARAPVRTPFRHRGRTAGRSSRIWTPGRRCQPMRCSNACTGPSAPRRSMR